MKFFVLGILVFACACIIGPMLVMRSGVASLPARPDPPPEPEERDPLMHGPSRAD